MYGHVLRPGPAVLGSGIAFIALTLAPPIAAAQESDPLLRSIDRRAEEYGALALEIWELAELGYQEQRSSKRLQEKLRRAGFRIEAGIAGMPTAFVAEWGSGKPVIGVLAEFDALPGLSQGDAPERQPVEKRGAGHACGHHLFGTGSTAAAIAVRAWLEERGGEGTIRLYGTPAEEGGSGKVYMTRAGHFDDVDVVLHWHPSDRNQAQFATTLANKSAKFRFRGRSAHAAGAPERGRSALDGVEAMNHMTNLLREHMPQDARLHYVITAGGHAPNVVPDYAEVYYYARHPEPVELQKLWERVTTCAEGATRGTGTTVDWEIIHGNRNLLPNETLAQLVDEKLRTVGGPTWNDEERAFAERLRASFDGVDAPLESVSEVRPFEYREQKGSTDVGDVSWMAPTIGFNTATWVPGTASHSWQAVACGGTSIGVKGMIVAAKTLALTARDLYERPEVIEAARREWLERRGADFTYTPLLGDREPPLDYRN